MRFTLTIESNNYAFTSPDEPTDLILGTLIAEVGQLVDEGFTTGPVTDPVNGRKVGEWEYVKGETEP